jgi:hypothetical protein
MLHEFGRHEGWRSDVATAENEGMAKQTAGAPSGGCLDSRGGDTHMPDTTPGARCKWCLLMGLVGSCTINVRPRSEVDSWAHKLCQVGDRTGVRRYC